MCHHQVERREGIVSQDEFLFLSDIGWIIGAFNGLCEHVKVLIDFVLVIVGNANFEPDGEWRRLVLKQLCNLGCLVGQVIQRE